MAGTYILRKFHSKRGDLPAKQVVHSADGAVDISLKNFTDTVVITKGSAAAITLAAPVAAHNGMRVTFIAASAYAHTITQSSDGFNGGGASKDVATLGGALGDGLTVEAYNLKWYVVSNINATLG